MGEEGEQEEEVEPKKAVQQMFTDYIAEHESTDSGVEEEEETEIVEEEDESPKTKKKKDARSKEDAVPGKDGVAETGKENKVKIVKRKAKTKAVVSDQKKAKKLLK